MIEVGANAYVTEVEYSAYASARGIERKLSTLQADIIKSADFINTYYSLQDKYKLPTTDFQAIAEINKAALKAVELQQAGRLTLDNATMTGAMIASESATLDGTGSESITYVEGSQVTYKPRTPELDLLLRSFVSGGSGLKRG